MPALFRSLLRAAGVVFLVAALHAADDEALRVIVVANSAEPESVRLAEAYAARRGIPRDNILALRMPTSELVSWPDFIATIQQPLQDELVRRRWIDGITMDLRDPMGRRKVAMSGHRISYLVVCRGVPLRITHSSELYAPAPPITNRAEFRTNGAAVDSELSLLAQSGVATAGFVPNPFFRNDAPSELEQRQVIRVSRLDGPSYEAALGLVDSALQAERDGLIGRAYVDTGGVHPDGERWLRLAADELQGAAFDLAVDRESTTMPATERADGAAWYLGWYAAQLNGPFALKGFRFAPGAIALHIHSFSASTLRAEQGGGWTGPLVARGVAATFGNVAEPYLQLTHQPQLLVRALLRGRTLGEAAYYALPALSWQPIVLGDPLYRPFGPTAEEIWARRDALSPVQRAYVTVREARRLDAARRRGDALVVLKTAFDREPGAVVGLELASRLMADKDLAAAAAVLESVPAEGVPGVMAWGVEAEVARALGLAGAKRSAVERWKRLLDADEIPPVARTGWLREAWKAATEAGMLEQATRWESDLQALGGSVNPP